MDEDFMNQRATEVQNALVAKHGQEAVTAMVNAVSAQRGDARQSEQPRHQIRRRGLFNAARETAGNLASNPRAALMPTNVARGWLRQDGDPRPLAARYQDVCEELSRLGGSPVVPASEISIQEMQSAIRELTRRKATADWDPVLARASGELSETVSTYRKRYNETVESQRRVNPHDPIYELLGLITPEVLKRPTDPQAMLDAMVVGGKVPRNDYPEIPGKLYLPKFTDVASFRGANAFVLDKIFALETLRNAITQVVHFGGLDATQQLRKIATALISRIDEIETASPVQQHKLSERLDQIEAQITNLAKTARYVRATKKELKHGKEHSAT
jgi:hypothetical protein